MRPEWRDYFYAIAKLCATRATCDRRHVGSVIVRDNHIVATGYNGSPPGLAHCDDVGHLIKMIDGRESCQRTTHAEQNALNTAARFGLSTEGATIYITDQPCLNCAKSIITAGIKSVIYWNDYPEAEGVQFLREAGVEVSCFKVEGND